MAALPSNPRPLERIDSFFKLDMSSIFMKGLSIVNKLFTAASMTILDLVNSKESQLISEPRLALRSAPPKAIPITCL